MSARQLNNAQARRIALRAQGFTSRERTSPVNRGHLRRLMRQLHLLQLDSVPVIVRTQYMPAFSRLGVYDMALLDDIAYRRDEWFEAFVHEASVLPVEDEPLFRFLKSRAERGEMWKHLAALAKRERAYIDSVLEEVTERGPLRASELSAPRPRDGEWWSSRSVGSVALDYLFRVGAVGIRRVGNFEKEFDLLDRIVPPHVRSVPDPSEEESMRELLIRSAAALGIATGPCLVDYFRLPKRPAAALLPQLVSDGSLVECRVEGTSRPAFMHPDTTMARSVDARALVSPFDPIVWNRPRNEWLFDFEYKIEIYVPKEKRQYGYYVLPFVLGDRIAARCDLKTDRNDGVLRVLGVWLEPHAEPETVDELAEELRMLAEFVGVNDVAVTRRSSVERHLAARLS